MLPRQQMRRLVQAYGDQSFCFFLRHLCFKYKQFVFHRYEIWFEKEVSTNKVRINPLSPNKEDKEYTTCTTYLILLLPLLYLRSCRTLGQTEHLRAPPTLERRLFLCCSFATGVWSSLHHRHSSNWACWTRKPPPHHHHRLHHWRLVAAHEHYPEHAPIDCYRWQNGGLDSW